MVGSNGFDQWLEHQLQNQAGGAAGPSPLPAQALYHVSYLQGGLQMSAIAKLTALVSTKSAIGLTVAVLAVGAGGVAAEAAITGSTNPKDWGQQVSAQVEKCKTALAPNTHGIGECVSTFASRNGQAHRANGARDNGADHRASGARGGDHPTGAPTNHPTAPTNHPTAPPSGPGRKP